jgi:hypothetical protein
MFRSSPQFKRLLDNGEYARFSRLIFKEELDRYNMPRFGSGAFFI